jgi:probable HAF family extracellular repeat protein
METFMRKHRSQTIRFRAALLWLLLALLPTSAARAQTYVIEDLGTLGGNQSGALAIDPFGNVAGISRVTPGSTNVHGFIYDGVMTDLGTLNGGLQSAARDMNRFGEAVGWSHREDGLQHAFLYKGGVMTGLGTFGSMSDARGINDAREIVGSSVRIPGFNERAFLWRGNGLEDLGTLGGTEACAYAINELGHICGFSQINSGDLRPFLYRDGVMTDLGSLGGFSGHAYDLNESGQVVGWSMMIPYNISHAFLWSEGQMVDLGTLGGVYSAAFGINNAGVIVGISTRANGDYAAFVWNGIKVVDLNTRIPPESGWYLTSASGVNDDGRIVGVGVYQGEQHAYRLTPGGLLDTGPPARVETLELAGAAPNPMLDHTRIRFQIPEPAHARVGIYDLSGRRVRLLADREMAAGSAELTWNGRDADGVRVRAGVYWIRMEAMGRTLTSRVAVLR